MLDTFFGLPVHALIVHATVVIVPTAAIVVAGAAFWPRFRSWAGYLPLLLGLAALVLVPLSTGSGEALEERVPETALVEQHAEMAEGLLPWVILLVVAGLALAVVRWRERPSAPGNRLPSALMVAVVLVAVVGAVGTTVQIARIGHAGAKASWSGVAG